MQDLTQREENILFAVIQSYIRTPEPVGSRSVAKIYKFNLSPATIRNVMSDLEDKGYLTHPHTSAGRMPTDKAYRLYADTILNGSPDISNSVVPKDLSRLWAGQAGDKLGVNEILKFTSRFLSSKSNNIGVVMLPLTGHATLKQIEFIKINREKVLAVIVGESGYVENKVISCDVEYTVSELEHIKNFLNQTFSGYSLIEIKISLEKMMLEEKRRFDKIVDKSMAMCKLAFEDEESSDIYYHGTSNIIEKPDFADVEELKILLKAFEEKSSILKLLNKCLEEEGVAIYIGAESTIEKMDDISIIASTYSTGENSQGTLGIVGPKRMNYSELIPLVAVTAKIITGHFNRV